MKFSIQKIDPINSAKFELGDLTIICGENNTGKTYIAHIIYGFLATKDQFLNPRAAYVSSHAPSSFRKLIAPLETERVVEINLEDFIKENLEKIIANMCRRYTNQIPNILANSRMLEIEKGNFSIDIDVENDMSYIEKKLQTTIEVGYKTFIEMSKDKGSSLVKLLVITESEDASVDIGHSTGRFLTSRIYSALMSIILDNRFPKSFIISPERTGAAIFLKELDFARNRIVEELGESRRNIDLRSILKKNTSRYSLPVRENVDNIRDMDEIQNSASFIAKQHPDILNKFESIAGGKYIFSKGDNEIYYKPDNSDHQITMGASSSSVRSLLMLDVYLRHKAEKGDLLIIDEPELNLHPTKMRQLARFLSQLVNAGIKVFITTHSDYLIRELNSLILLNQKRDIFPKIIEKNNAESQEEADKYDNWANQYTPNEFLDYKKIKVYNAIKESGEGTTLAEVIIDEDGIEIESFDENIDEMNYIQNDLIYGSKWNE